MKIKLFYSCALLLMMSVSLQAQESDADESSGKTQEVQEVKYVTDKLRLSLYKNASDKSGTIKLLVSGDALDVLEKQGPYSKVTTREGDTGWVKNGFLVSTPTASFQLVEEQKKNEILARQIEQYSDTQKLVDDYENTISKISEDLSTIQQQLNETKDQLEQVNKENASLNEQIEATKQGKFTISDLITLVQQFWYLVAGSVFLLFFSGFMVGRELVEAQVRKRFQGVKVW